MKKFTKQVKEAIQAYYQHRDENNALYANNARPSIDNGSPQPWDKQADLDSLDKATALPDSGIRSWAACAGTFWFTWYDGKVTVHSKKNWQKMRSYPKYQF